jgi:hypothetical protein
MTEAEKEELENIFNISIYSTEYLPHETYTDLFKRKLIEFIEQKKKEWQEEAHLIYVENNEGVERHNFKWRCGQEKELLIEMIDWLNKKYPKNKVVQNTIIYEMERQVSILNEELLKIDRGENIKYYKFK